MALVCLACACQLRRRWEYFSRRKRSFLLPACSTLVLAYAFMRITGWHFASLVADEMVGSLALGGYALLVLLLTLLRSKWVAYSATGLLLLAVPCALIWLPLSAYSQFPIETEHIAGTLFVKKIRWDAGAMGSSGINFLIYDKPVPFAEHGLQTVIFDDRKCISANAFLVLQPDGRHVLARCPWYEYQHRQGFHDFLVPLN